MKKTISLLLSITMLLSVVSGISFPAKAATEWVAIASSDFSAVNEAVSNGSLGEVPTYKGQGNPISWSTVVWTDNGYAKKESDALYIPDGYMYMSGYEANENSGLPIKDYSTFKIDFEFSYKDETIGGVHSSDGVSGDGVYTFMKIGANGDALSDSNAGIADYSAFSQDAGGRTYAYGSLIKRGNESTRIATSGNNIRVSTSYHYIVEYTGVYARAYVTDSVGNVVQEEFYSKDSYIVSLFDIGIDVANYMKIGDSRQSNYLRGLEYKNITFYTSNTEIIEPLPVSENDKYLYAYYTSYNEAGEKLHYAVSSDGINFKVLNKGKTVWNQYDYATDELEVFPSKSENSIISKHARDPYVFKGQDNKYYILATDNDTQEQGFNNNSTMLVWKLDKLEDIDTTKPWVIDTTNIFNVEKVYRTWAPQAIWDSKEKKYMLYFAAKTSESGMTEMCYTYTEDFKSFTEPNKLLPSADFNNYDGDIIYNSSDGLYYMYFTSESDNNISYATSSNCNGPYSNISGILADNYSNSPQVHQLSDGSYILSISPMTGRGQKLLRGFSAKSFLSTVKTTSDCLYASQGSVIKITNEEYNALINKFASKAEANEVELYFSSGQEWSNGQYSYNIKDPSLNCYDLNKYDKYSAKAGVLSLENSNIFISDKKSRNIIKGEQFSLVFSHKLTSSKKRSKSYTVAAISNDETDFIRLCEDGTFIVGDTECNEKANIYTDTTDQFIITYNNSVVSLYQNGKYVTGSVLEQSIAEENSKLYISLGWSAKTGTFTNADYSDFLLSPLVKIGSQEPARKFTVSVTDEKGNAINGGYTVSWFEKGKYNILATGNNLIGADNDKEYQFDILLGESLSYTYKQPSIQNVVSQGNNSTCVVKLEKIKSLRVSGRVKDSDGAPISDAKIAVTQTFNDKYEKKNNYSVDANGNFSFDCSDVPTRLLIEADGYYNQTKKISNTNEHSEIDLGTIEMKKLPRNKITFELSKVYAVSSGQESIVTDLTSANGISFTLYNKTQKKEINQFSVQYPNIFLNNEEVSANDEILISAADNSNQMTAQSVSVKLDGDKLGSCKIKFVENGKFSVASVTGSENSIMMIFDEAGRFISSAGVLSNTFSDALPAGKYSVLFMKKTGLLRSVSDLNRLSDFNLVENSDYIIKEVSIQNGVISEIESVIIPILDESKLYYTVNENTKLTSNVSSCSVGKYIIMRCEYKIDDKYSTDNETISIELPKTVEFASGSLSLNGKTAAYSLNKNTLQITTNKKEGIIRFYIVPGETGSLDINAYLSFKSEGSNIVQPIGTASVTVESAKLNAPEKTSQKDLTVTGITMANSTVTVFDNDVEVGKTKSNASGSWYLDFELVKTYSFSRHEIYAQIENKNIANKIVTDRHLVVFDKNYCQASKVIMINTAHPTTSLTTEEYKTVFDFIHPSKVTPSYRYWPSYPKFTFTAEFIGGDKEKLSNVYVVTTDSAGEKTYVSMTYDKASGMWIGTHSYYNSSETPVSLYVAFDNDVMYEEDEVDKEYVEDVAETVAEEIDAHLDTVSIDDTYSFENNVEKEGYISSDVSCGDSEDGNLKFIIEENPDDLDVDPVTDSSFSKVDVNGKDAYVKQETTNDTYSIIFYDVENKQLYRIKAEKTQSDKNSDQASTMRQIKPLKSGKDRAQLDSLTWQDVLAFPAKFTPVASGILKGFETRNLKITLMGNYDSLLSEIVGVRFLINASCPDGSMRLSHNDILTATLQLNNLQNATEEYYSDWQTLIGVDMALWVGTEIGSALFSEWCGNAVKKGVTSAVGKYFKNPEFACDFISEYVTAIPTNAYGNLIDSIMDMSGNMQSGYFSLYNRISVLRKWVMSNYKDCKKKDKDKDKEPKDKSPESDSDLIEDPSGYVYEAVPSNRLEGVKAEAYYYDYKLDEFGVPEETKSDNLWDAENYSQANPLYTDKNGEYAWDVPVGQWLVKFSKEGYYDTDSRNDPAVDEEGYLPVPPPQTEVNVAMVSKAAPEVEEISIYNDEIRIAFTQYMQIDSVNTKNVLVNMYGRPISGLIKPINAEYDYEHKHQYASKFVFTPDISLSGIITVNVADVINYAGTKLKNTFEKIDRVAPKPESISANDEIEVTYNSGALLEVEVLPAEAGAGKTLEVSTSSPSIAGIVNENVVLDENGKANIMLSGNLPGDSEITITLSGTDLTKTVKASVADVVEVKNQCEKVTASVKSGKTVEKGTKVELSTTTEGAEIYYTLDGTCPCTADSASRIKYTEPIEINEETFIIAYAVKDGLEESYTAGFTYFVEDEHTEHTPAKAVKENVRNATYDKEGSYDEVVYCSVCGKEISRKTVKVAKLKKTSLSKASVSGIVNKTYSGKKITQKVAVKLGKTTLKNSTDYKVTYKNNTAIGKATLTITGINKYSGTITKTFKINPKGTSLSSVTAKSKSFTAKWKKQTTKTTGYEIQYSTDKNFKKGNKTVTVKSNKTTTTTVKKLAAKKKYYVRIRTYKTVSGTKYCSAWSSSKNVTTKK